MIRFRRADSHFDSFRVHLPIAVLVAGLVLLPMMLGSSRVLAASANCSAAGTSTAPTASVAVAPFVGEKEALAISKALGDELARTSIERLIAPGDFVAERVFEPSATEVRRWAYNSAVDAIVVGRVYSTGNDAPQTRIIETVLRSGHSGAALSRHEVSTHARAGYQEAVQELALLILGDLGISPAASDCGSTDGRSSGAASTAPSPSVTATGAPHDRPDVAAKGDLASIFPSSGFRSDAPIEINAEEAEIISHADGRRLIFQRNVHVRQGNIELRSDRLEAYYQKGESEPRELLAEGNVLIVQDDRRAKCDSATYLRKASRLICDGNAELVQGCDIVRGESIKFDLAGNNAVVDGAASIVIEPKRDGPSTCIADQEDQ